VVASCLIFIDLFAGDGPKSSSCMDLIDSGSGWELALVTTQSNNTSHVVDSKLVWT